MFYFRSTEHLQEFWLQIQSLSYQKIISNQFKLQITMMEGYQQLWKAIIRPPRAKYADENLGPKVFKFHGLKVERTDVQLTNKRGFKLKCSHFQPYIRPAKVLPCVIYLHGNSSCRLQGRSCIPYILSHDITLFTFDFSGCGNSEGQYISLGYYQKDDVDVVFQYLRSLQTVSSIGLWGRSMGAVTALMYADKNPEIACIVCDSPFSNLEKLCKQLADRFAGGFISFFSGVALSFVAKTIKEKNNFDISSLDPLGKHVSKAYIPAFFIAAKDDNFIVPKHCQKLHEAYSGQKKIIIVQGDHNSERDQSVNQAISSFFYNNLHVHQLVVRDQAYIKQQHEQKGEQKNKIEQKGQIDKKLKPLQQNIFNQLQDQERMLQMAIRLSLGEAKVQQKQKQQEKHAKQYSSQNDQQKKKIKNQKSQWSDKEKSKDQPNNLNSKEKVSPILLSEPDLIELLDENIDQDELDERKAN